MGKLSKAFVRGLMTVIPIVVTVYVLYLVGSAVESALGGILMLVLPDQYYLPGMGLTLAVVLVLGIGLLKTTRVMRSVSGYGENLLLHIPLVGTVYGPTRDLMSFFQRAREGKFDQVVVVHFGEANHVLGFVTRDDFSEVPAGIGGNDMVAVYFPMSYQVGGYTVMMPRASVQPVDMTMREAMRFALTAGMSLETVNPQAADRKNRPSRSGPSASAPEHRQ